MIEFLFDISKIINKITYIFGKDRLTDKLYSTSLILSIFKKITVLSIIKL